MTFNTEKNKLFKLWNDVEENRSDIIKQLSDNTFLIESTDELNRADGSFSSLINFSTDWLTPTVITTTANNGDTILAGNFQEFKLIFKLSDNKFIPYIHAEAVYRANEGGTIPLASDGTPFDEQIGDGNRLQKSEIWQIGEEFIEYITYIRMDFLFNTTYEIQYKFHCYLVNPYYYST